MTESPARGREARASLWLLLPRFTEASFRPSLTRYRLLALESDAANCRRAGLKHLLKVNCKVKVNRQVKINGTPPNGSGDGRGPGPPPSEAHPPDFLARGCAES